MIRRLPLTLQQITYNLRGGFLVRPLCIAMVLGFSGGLLSWLEELYPDISAWIPFALFPSRSDPQVAQIILSDIASSVMTVVSIVFAILLMSLTLASMQFSPRIIVSFSKDRVTQWTLGLFLGTFSYCIAALPAARSRPFPFSPVLSVFVAMILALACVVGLLFFIHHISRAISVNHIADRIASETELVIDELMPKPLGHKLWPVGASSGHPVRMEIPVNNDTPGYIRFIDTANLMRYARHYQLKVCVLKRVGQFVPAGVPLLRVSKQERLTPEARTALLSTVDVGPTRTLQQDIEFGVLQIVDIALKAISPAVNDPTTAICCVDQLSRIVGRFSLREFPQSHFYDPPGVIRVSVPWIGFDALLESAFDQIRAYGRTDIAVSLRLLRALTDIAMMTDNDNYHRSLLDLGHRTLTSCAPHQDECALERLHGRMKRLESVVSRSYEADSTA